jgi:hypothetical protein
MSKDLSKIYTRLQKAVCANFSQVLVIEGTIETINNNEHFFVIRSLDGTNTIECRTNEDLSKFKDRDAITVKGWLRLYPNSPCKMYIAVEYLYPISEKQKYDNAFIIYKCLLKTLHTNKCQEIIKDFVLMAPPQVVNNVGLVVLPDNDNNLENFIKIFKEKCLGNLFIFRLRNGTVDSSLEIALEYFKKYHNVDLICLLTNQLTFKHVCDLSSKNNVKFMINRKKFPYIVSIVSSNKEQITMEPLTVILSNTKFDSIFGCIDFIQEIQMSFKKQLETGIICGTNILRQLLDNEKKKLFDHKIRMAELIDPRCMVNINSSIFDKLKFLIVQKMNYERNNLHHMKTILMKNILDDPRVQHFFDAMIKTENKNRQASVQQALILPPSVPQPSVSQPSVLPSVPQPSVSQPSVLPSVPQPSVPQPSVLPSVSQPSVPQLPLYALRPNDFYQLYPPNIPHVTHNMDPIKKIENKLADNSQEDIYNYNYNSNNNNIQRENGNDF